MAYPGLRLLLGVSSSIAAFRALDIASTIIKGGGEVRAVLTPNATKLVGPAAFDAITHKRSIVSLWESDHSGEMDHLEATKWANVFAVAPATAATLARLTVGLADDALSTLAIAWPRPLVIAPAMNPTMYQHPTVQANLAVLRGRGHRIVGPAWGLTACGDRGQGRLADVEDILIAIVDALRDRRDVPNLTGHHVLITSGPTREFADPVRCITNPSTGRMGIALARQALNAGARVTVVTGPCDLPFPDDLTHLERVVTAEEMRDAVLRLLPEATIAVFAAAVSDWRPAEAAAQKAKKEDGPQEMTLHLVRTPDVATEASKARRPGQVFVGFAAETENLLANARDKMRRKGFDLVVANPVSVPGAGFGTETNQATLVGEGLQREVPQTTKDLLALEILAEAVKLAKT
ncbi:MAG: bifunctional phosphopantothenoylcysteine decarboxylase/phosphopantothenate--cysteine ligase CoaBC [Candidatus Sumerlaeia bacterium]|nr:bifunctional phosphopantothenoylcysteine decarboxylase/phosphopantothenate--cysteine ligase CoaBC [Candidatus Sumerlaeia bacterium]